LHYYLQLSHYGLMEKSRVLDEQFTQHSLHSVLTGMWIIANPMIENNTHKYTVLPTIPTAENTMQGASILSADCLSIAAQSQYKKQAETFIRFLTEYRNSKRFSIAVPDAGFPADTAIINDNELQNNPLRKGFLQQTLYSHRLLHLPSQPRQFLCLKKKLCMLFTGKKLRNKHWLMQKWKFNYWKSEFPKENNSISFLHRWLEFFLPLLLYFLVFPLLVIL
jgi:hypothetical protein